MAENGQSSEPNDLFAGLDSFLSTPEDGEINLDKTEDNKGTPTTENKDQVANLIEIPDNQEQKETTTEEPVELTEESTEDAQKAEADALKQFAKVLVENNVFEDLDLESYDGSLSGLKDAVYNQAKKLVEEREANLPPVIKDLIENYEEGVPLEDLIKTKSTTIKYSSLDTEKLNEDVNLQKQVYKDFLKKTTAFNDARIEKEIKRLEDLDELSKEAEEALPELLNFEKQEEKRLKEETKKRQEEAKKANEDALNNIKIKTEDFKNKEIVPGIKLTEKDVSSVFKSLTTPVGYDDNGRPISEIQKLRQEDPIGFEIRLNYLAKLTKGFTDFTPIVKKAASNATTKLEQVASTPVLKGGKSMIVEEESSKNILSAASSFLSKYQK